THSTSHSSITGMPADPAQASPNCPVTTTPPTAHETRSLNARRCILQPQSPDSSGSNKCRSQRTTNFTTSIIHVEHPKPESGEHSPLHHSPFVLFVSFVVQTSVPDVSKRIPWAVSSLKTGLRRL